MESGTAIRRLFGGLLLAAGILMALSCGLCTGFFGIMSLVAAFQGERGDFGTVGPFLGFGMIGTVIGIGLAFAGRNLLRKRQP